MDRTEKTYCLFSTSQDGFCSGPRHTHVNNLFCINHLKQYFGLEVASYYVEKQVETCFGGWNLRPAPGTHFKKNDIIVPTRPIIDSIYRSKKDKSVITDETKYGMNHILEQYLISATSSGNRLSVPDRRSFEMLRNFSVPLDNINLNPIELCETDPAAVAYLKSKLTMSQTYIEEYGGYPLEGFTIPIDGQLTDLVNRTELSYHYKYFLSKAEFSSHVVSSDDNIAKETHRMNYNAMYIPDVGLVATRDISNPNTIVIFGASHGSWGDTDGFYKTHVICFPKEIVQPRISAHMIPQQNALKKAFVTGAGFR